MICNLDRQYTVPKNHGQTFNLHYMFLSGDDRRIYDAIFEAIDSYEYSVKFNRIVDQNQVWRVYLDVLADNPTLFWAKKELGYEYGSRESKITFSYLFQKGEVDDLKIKMTRKVEEIHKECSRGCLCDMDLAIRVHDYLTENILYVNDGNPEQQSMVGPLMRGKGVCEGIAFTYSYLMGVFGVNCTTVYGQVKGEPNGHAWNIIFIDGQAYHVDVTHDLGCTSYPGNHIHMNLKDSDLINVRDWDTLVKCEEDVYNYYTYTNRLLDTFDEVCDYIRRNLKDGIRAMEFRILSNPPREPAIKQLTEYIRSITREFQIGWGGTGEFYYLQFDKVRLR